MITKILEFEKQDVVFCQSPSKQFPSCRCTNHDLIGEEAHNFIAALFNAADYHIEVDFDRPFVFVCELVKFWNFGIFLNLYAHEQGIDSRLLNDITSIKCSQAHAWQRWKWIFA